MSAIVLYQWEQKVTIAGVYIEEPDSNYWNKVMCLIILSFSKCKITHKLFNKHGQFTSSTFYLNWHVDIFIIFQCNVLNCRQRHNKLSTISIFNFDIIGKVREWCARSDLQFSWKFNWVYLTFRGARMYENYFIGQYYSKCDSI